ncbi:arabinose-5-phosphate isomerase [Alkalispirillum mobile]|uniref:Arabinose 5-phosphate isomerase n=1 Tax=Alkalispirillum mobile TaxID=85925 RepID=A0A498C197_9GAMM|nr:KpsF/GutQ family sugar-phosphate isomerase [Alkalispirillum mobile]RLK46890.1 arabinose-5-phosphate isomerase [Alkalispirillum mobile]
MNAQKTLVESQRRHAGEPPSDERFRALGRAVLELEADAVRTLTDRVDETFSRACRHMLGCRGRVVVTGMGKSGHIANKIAATLASTGTPAFFVHPGEASHGDLGMITRDDVVMALSNSGETGEITTILPLIRRLHVPLIALTGNPDSTLARAADDHLDVSVAQEACPLGLAPTASTTAALAMGDALAIALLEARGFTADDFARSHPGGRLGRRLLLLVEDVMHTGQRIPRVAEATPLAEALLEITRKGLGMTAVVDGDDRILGVFTDGDLRRCLDQGRDIHALRVGEVMTRDCRTVHPDALAAEALEMMESHRINALLVSDGDARLLGALNMHDLLRAGVV